MKLDTIQNNLELKLIENDSKHLKLSFISYYETIAILENNLSHLARARFYLAKQYSLHGRLNESNNLLKRNIPQFRQLKDNNFLCDSLSCLAKNKWKQGNIEEALNHFNIASQLLNVSNKSLAELKSIYVEMLILFKDYSRAIVVCEKVISNLSMDKILERNIYIEFLTKISEIYRLDKQPVKAKKILKKLEHAKVHSKLVNASSYNL